MQFALTAFAQISLTTWLSWKILTGVETSPINIAIDTGRASYVRDVAAIVFNFVTVAFLTGTLKLNVFKEEEDEARKTKAKARAPALKRKFVRKRCAAPATSHREDTRAPPSLESVCSLLFTRGVPETRK